LGNFSLLNSVATQVKSAKLSILQQYHWTFCHLGCRMLSLLNAYWNIRELGYRSDFSNALRAGTFGIPCPGWKIYYFFFIPTFQTGHGAIPL